MHAIMHRPLFLAAVVPTIVAIVALVGAACGGGGSDATPVPTTAALQVNTAVISSDLAPGPNRFILGLIDQAQNTQILGAQVHLRFFKLEGTESTLKAEVEATSVRLVRSYAHTHTDGTVETHEAGETGVYVAAVEFDSPGNWAVEVTGEADGQPISPPAFTFSVHEQSISPALGSPAPRSVQAILSDVSDITEIDTSIPPNPAMHDMTIADAVTSGKPSVIVFSTPAFASARSAAPLNRSSMTCTRRARRRPISFMWNPTSLTWPARERGSALSPPSTSRRRLNSGAARIARPLQRERYRQWRRAGICPANPGCSL